MRRLLLAAGGPAGEPVGPPPTDPTLTEWRGVSQMTGTNQNTNPIAAGGKTFRTTYRMGADGTGLTFTWTAHIQGLLDGPYTASATYEGPDGALIPLTFDGAGSFSLDNYEWVESDRIDVTLSEADTFYLRVFCPEQAAMPEGGSLGATYMSGDHRTGTWTPGDGVTSHGPVPVAVLGHARPSTFCPAMIGDSIAAMGRDTEGWWRTVMGTRPAMSFGRNATNFGSLDEREGDALRGATHLIVEYGSNDLRGNYGSDFSSNWTAARAAYAYYDNLNPGIPIWQTTCLPICNTSDGCTTLEGQNSESTVRLSWNAWLRDGAPIHPSTKVALSVGASGLRAGDDGHPLAGVIDIAAEVEQGGTSSPTGKWRVGPGGQSWGGDGVHPDIAGQARMAIPLIAWRDEILTA